MNRNDPTTRNMLRAVRRNFENAVPLRTYSIPWIQAGEGDLFYADAPWNARSEEALLDWLEKAEREGGKALDFQIRNTRMTISFATRQEA